MRSLFNTATIEAIILATQNSEAKHSGQIRFAVEGSLEMASLMKNQSPRNRAIEVFSQLKIWDTELNNGVLIYVLLADKAVEIIADRGVNNIVDLSSWNDICRKIQSNFSSGDFQKGALLGIECVGTILEKSFPKTGYQQNEIPDNPVFLG